MTIDFKIEPQDTTIAVGTAFIMGADSQAAARPSLYPAQAVANMQPQMAANTVKINNTGVTANAIDGTRLQTRAVLSIPVDVVLDYNADKTGASSASAAIQNALNYVASIGGGVVSVPAGTFLLTSTLTLYPKCSIIGAGFGRTIFTRTADYGNTMEVGAAVIGQSAQDVEIAGIWFIHQHTYVAGTTTTLDNPVTAGTKHLNVHSGQRVYIHDNWFHYLGYSIYLDGGVQVSIERNLFLGIWDPKRAGLQEGVAYIALALGVLGDIPTGITIDKNYISGVGTGARPVYWDIGTELSYPTTGFTSRGAWADATAYALKDLVTDGGSVTYVCSSAHTSAAGTRPGIGATWADKWQIYSANEDAGSKYGIMIETCEYVSITANYIGGPSIFGVWCNAKTICAGLSIGDNYFDGCTQSQIRFDYSSTYAINVNIESNNFFGAGVTGNAISSGFSGANPSTTFLNIVANTFRDQVKTPILLTGTIGGMIANNIIANYNYFNLDSNFTSILHGPAITIYGAAGSGVSRSIRVQNNSLGGGGGLFADGADATNHCEWGVYTTGLNGSSDIKLSGNVGLIKSGGGLLGGDMTTQTAAMEFASANTWTGVNIFSGNRTYFYAASEAFAVGARYNSGGGTVYFGATNSATPDAIISNNGGGALATFKNSGVAQLNQYASGTLRTDATGNISAAAVGYVTGDGGTVTQATNKSTAFTLSKLSGQITLNGAALAADTTVSATWTNTTIAATDVVVFSHVSGGTLGAYTFNAQCAAGSATLNIRNVTPGSLSEAPVIQFNVIKGVTA